MDPSSNVPSSCHILSNSPALHSLKRQQLVQLCKRNGIKATGKNADIIAKLKAHAQPLNPSDQPFSSDDDGDKENKRIAMPRPSETWTVIEEDSREIERVHLGLKGIREEVEQEMGTMSSMKSFGVSSSGEFGTGTTSSKGSSMSSSLKAFATSLKRGGPKLSTAPTPNGKLTMHTEGPILDDLLAATSTPYHALPPTSPQLPDPEPLDVDDSRDQSMLELGASTIRLVTTAPSGPSPPSLRPFTPAFEVSYTPGSPSVPSIYPSLPVDEESDRNPPGAFPGIFSTPSSPKSSTNLAPPHSPTQPFVFGSPAHKISNTEFHTVAASVLADMNARLGLTGTSNEVGLDLLQKRQAAAEQASASPPRQEKSRTDLTSKFDKAHEREFEKMEGLGAWHAKRAAVPPIATRKRKSDVLGGPLRRPVGPSNARGRRTSRVVTPGTRRSLVAAAEAEEADGRKVKRVRISAFDGEGRRVPSSSGAQNRDEGEMEVDEETGKSNEERERERAAIKKKLEVSRARRRSSMGRVSVGGGRAPLIPNQPKKGISTKFGFLSSAKSLVKNVWNKGVGTSAAPASKPTSTLLIPKPSQAAHGLAGKKPGPNVLTKAPPPAPVLKAAKTSAKKPSIVQPDPNTSLRVPAQGVGLGLGRKTSTKWGSGTGSSVGTRSSTTSLAVVSRSSTVSSNNSAAPLARRGPIPAFQPTRTRISSFTRAGPSATGTAGSRTSSNDQRTLSSQGGSIGRPGMGAGSMGMRKNGIKSPSVTGSDAGSVSTNGVRKRTSTLFAPTASSLAKMQSTVKPPNPSLGPAVDSSVDVRGSTRAPQPHPPVPNGLPGFTFTSPPAGGVSTPVNGAGSIFTRGTPTFSPSQPPPPSMPNPKSRALPTRRPRISRSRVIAKVSAQRTASGSSLASTASARRSLNPPKVRGSLGARASGIGARGGGREAAAAMSARKRLRQSEVLRRRSRIGGSLAHREGEGEREETPERDSEDDRSASLEVPMED